MGAARAIDDEILEKRLRVKPETLEGGDRPLLLDGHLGDDLAQAQVASDREDLSRQHSTEAVRAEGKSHLDADLAEMALPGDLVVVEAYVSGHLASRLGDDRDRALGGDVFHPLSD